MSSQRPPRKRADSSRGPKRISHTLFFFFFGGGGGGAPYYNYKKGPNNWGLRVEGSIGFGV